MQLSNSALQKQEKKERKFAFGCATFELRDYHRMGRQLLTLMAITYDAMEYRGLPIVVRQRQFK